MTGKTGYYIEELKAGMTDSLEKTIGEAEIKAFARLTGDFNPVHLDKAYAARTVFGRPIAHGMLVAGLISAVLGTKMPGAGAIYVSQSLRFRAPVFAGDTVLARVEVMDVNIRRRRVKLTCSCLVAEKTVVNGEAVLIAPSRG